MRGDMSCHAPQFVINKFITNCGVITNCVVLCAAICNKQVYYKLQRYYKLRGDKAAIIKFHRANKIRCDKTVLYPTMLILPNIFFAHCK